MKAHERLKQWWQTTPTSVSLELPSDSEIEQIEARYALRIPDAFREYLRYACPKTDAWDAENSTWWSFGRIKNITEEYTHELQEVRIADRASQYLVFADYAIWCWAWAIACTSDENRGKVALIGGNPDRFVANSLAEFIEAYTRDFRSIC